jgi:hypothetical protein
MGALLVLGLVGGCLGVFDEAEVEPAVSTQPPTSTASPATVVPYTAYVVAPPAETPPVVTAPIIAEPSNNPLPSVGGQFVDEIDCERAEEYADSGEYEAGDIADFGDYGPDDGSELPDEFDWDE